MGRFRYGSRARFALAPDKGIATMRRINAVPAMLVDFSLIAGIATTGMMLVLGLIYVTTALGRVDPFLL